MSEAPTITFPELGTDSPRKLFLREFNLAFIEGDVEATLGFFAEDVIWNLVGEGIIEGREGMRAWLLSMAGKKARRVEFKLLITDDRSAAVNGTYEMESGSKFEFCDIYEFADQQNDSPISRYTSYVVRI